MIKNIIFDFDGVLVDSEIIVLKAFSKYMQECRIKTNEKELANLVGKPTIVVIDILSEKYFPENKKEFSDDIMNIASNIYKKESLSSEIIAKAGKNIIGELIGCKKLFCKIDFDKIEGFVEKKYLWGINQN